MSKVISSFCILISIGQLSIGIWEAVITAQNAPNSSPNSDAHNQEIYAFAVTKAVCNIIGGLVLLCTGALLCCIEPSSDKSSDSGKNGTFQFICFGTSVWGLVRYFNEGFRDSLIQPFQQVLLVEMGYFFSLLSLLVLGICFGCCFLCFNARETQETTAKIDKYNKASQQFAQVGPIGVSIGKNNQNSPV